MGILDATRQDWEMLWEFTTCLTGRLLVMRVRWERARGLAAAVAATRRLDPSLI